MTAIVGKAGLLKGPHDTAGYEKEPRDMFRGRALSVIRPATVEQVSQVLALCNESGTGVVPQGGNTGLVGGQTPDASGRQIILSLQRLDRIREIDPASDILTCEAGVVLARVQEAAESVDRYFPLSLASEGSCTIGGNLATNAGGVHVIAYGSARDLCLGVEVVLADGRIFNGLSKLRKDNSGYNLAPLFVGSEGTLGVITAATLKLFPRLRARVTAFIGLNSPRDALDLLSYFKSQMGSALQAFELMPRIAIDFVLKHGRDARDPIAETHPWYALVEFASIEESGFEDAVVAMMERAAASYPVAVAIAASLEQRAALWRLRETLPESQKHEGASIKHDVSVPLQHIPEFVKEAGQAVQAIIPGARPVPFGHVGDGNIHFNVSQPVGADKEAFLARWDEVNAAVHEIVSRYDGSIAAEHGVGQLKRELLARTKDPVALDLMRTLKASLDPKGVLNPGKVL